MFTAITHISNVKLFIHLDFGRTCECFWKYLHSTFFSFTCGDALFQLSSSATKIFQQQMYSNEICSEMDCVKYLVEEAGAKLQPDAFGMLPIHDAVINNHPVVRAYLQQLQVNTDLGLPNTFEHSRQEQMERVYGLIVKEGIFSHYLVRDEVLYFYGPLGFDGKYFHKSITER